MARPSPVPPWPPRSVVYGSRAWRRCWWLMPGPVSWTRSTGCAPLPVVLTVMWPRGGTASMALASRLSRICSRWPGVSAAHRRGCGRLFEGDLCFGRDGLPGLQPLGDDRGDVGGDWCGLGGVGSGDGKQTVDQTGEPAGFGEHGGGLGADVAVGVVGHQFQPEP